jgi:hypothetical protein
MLPKIRIADGLRTQTMDVRGLYGVSFKDVWRRKYPPCNSLYGSVSVIKV